MTEHLIDINGFDHGDLPLAEHTLDPRARPQQYEAAFTALTAKLPAPHGPHAAMYARDVETLPDERIGLAEQGLLAAERQAALREAFAQLPPNGQQLISLLIADPPVPYADISAQLGIPVGSIGPNRSRYLSKMRRHPAIAALLNA